MMAIHRTSESSGVSVTSRTRVLVEFRVLRSAIVSLIATDTQRYMQSCPDALGLPPHLRLTTDAPCNAMQL